MNEHQRQDYLQAMGIQVWRKKSAPTPLPISPIVQCDNSIEQLSWDDLSKRVAACVACSLHKTRKQTVFGVGNQQAELMIVGEAPGAEEDKRGQPFVGRAGQLLDAMLLSMGLPREQVYIANILKCRPPSNRDPLPEEVAECTPFLQRQVALVNPKLILAVGRIAAHYLLKTNEPLNRLRGRQHVFGTQQTPLLITYHPAYLLRAPSEKRKAFKDLQAVMKLLRSE